MWARFLGTNVGYLQRKLPLVPRLGGKGVCTPPPPTGPSIKHAVNKPDNETFRLHRNTHKVHASRLPGEDPPRYTRRVSLSFLVPRGKVCTLRENTCDRPTPPPPPPGVRKVHTKTRDSGNLPASACREHANGKGVRTLCVCFSLSSAVFAKSSKILAYALHSRFFDDVRV